MRDIETVPWWQRITLLKMWEGENDTDDNDDNDSETEDDDDDDDDDADSNKDGSKGKGNDESNIDGLKSALAKERKDRKKFERDFKRLEREKGTKDQKDASDLETTTEKLTKSAAKLEKLGQALVKTAIDTAIIEAATAEKFRDVTDALDLVNRDDIEFELDLEDDDVDFEFDKATVISAVKKLATKKPHLIIADGDGEPSGGKAGSKKGKKSDQELTEETLRDRYPALRG